LLQFFADGADNSKKKQRITLEDLGVLQLVAHDLFNVDRAAEVDKENGLLDLSTLFDYGDENIALGGEFRNRENIMLFTVASEFGQKYLEFLDEKGINKNKAKKMTIELYHNKVKEVYEKTFGESFPEAKKGKATMTENLALRTVHDFLPGKIKVDGQMISVLDPSLHGKKLTPSELMQKSAKLDGKFDQEFRNISIVVDGHVIEVDLLEADSSFAIQFSTEFSFEYFLEELEDGTYDQDEKVMDEIRNLFAKGTAL